MFGMNNKAINDGAREFIFNNQSYKVHVHVQL